MALAARNTWAIAVIINFASIHPCRRERRSAFARILAVAFLVQLPSPGAVEPVSLQAYPQKVRKFYRLEDSAVPPALRTNLVSPSAEKITASVRATDGAMWLGTTQGLTRVDSTAPARDRRQYFGGRRYLPDDWVVQMAATENGGVWVRTRTGVSHIELKPMTLAQKAAHFEQRIHARHNRYGLVADSALTVAGDPSSNQMHDNDNDGLWTAMYAAAECFRYAVTKSPEALTNGRTAVEAVLFLEEVAGRRGFPARSYVKKGDRMPQGGEWHWTKDGQYYWKADTSSDEIVGHFFIFSIAYDLLPDAALKQRIADTCARIMDHIIQHDYYLVDLDGKPTRWGIWNPKRLVEEPDERALNCMQLLSFLKTAAHVTGRSRYQKEYEKVAWELKYADWLGRVNEFRTEMNYSDEELAMLPYYCLFRYEQDPRMLVALRRGLDEWWQNMRRELNPLWTFIYLTGQPDAKVDLAGAAWTLYRMPMDTIEWTVRNSHRQDIEWVGKRDRFGRREAATLLPPDERPVMKWNGNPFIVDGGGGGHAEDDGAAFLLPYWMGRYHRFIVGE